MSHAEVQEFSSGGLEGNVAFPGDKPVRWGATDKGGGGQRLTVINVNECSHCK